MVNKKHLFTLSIAGILSLGLLAGCTPGGNAPAPDANSALTEDEALQQGMEIDRFEGGDAAQAPDGGEGISFRPVDCGIQAQEVYEYPFIGLRAVLTQDMLQKINDRDVFLSAKDAYTIDNAIQHAMLKFFAPTQVQKSQEGTSIDYDAWEAGLEKVGVLGVYQKDEVEQLDQLTGCDTHQKLGESADGAYVYYLSTSSNGDQDLIRELEASEVTITEMRPFDPNYTYDAFSAGRADNVSSVGEFSTEDVFGNTYTQDIFRDYDLTLVNAFTTWCSPCVEEMPELEKLRQAFIDKGIKFNVVAVVIDTKNETGTDEGAMEKARILHEKSGAQFPFLTPDAGNMNDRLKGLESFPESFFVDKDGNIVSDPYLGARSLDEWAKIVEQELAELTGK